MKSLLLLLCFPLAVHAETSSVHLLATPHYQVRITDPGFRMEVSSAKGVILPADPEAGLLFSGHPAVSSKEIHRADGLARFRVTNAKGQTALAEVKTAAHHFVVTIMPLGKTPVFVGGKGVYVSRTDDASPLQAVVFPIATGGSSCTFTHPDGTSKSTVVNDNTGWYKAILTVTDTTTGSPTKFTIDSTTGAIRFDLQPGHSYRLGGGA